VEALWGLFDFNHAPFFQSFMQVRVERSKRRVVLTLYGVDGPLHWRDLQTGGAVLAPEANQDGPVEFTMPMDYSAEQVTAIAKPDILSGHLASAFL
jgi:hypothetical protein